MTLVSSSYTYATNQSWQSSPVVSTDPASRVGVELQNWINGLSGTPLAIRKTPANCTSLNTTTAVRWIITGSSTQANFFGSYPIYNGFRFMERGGDSGSAVHSHGAIHFWYDSTTNNNSGTWFNLVTPSSVQVAQMTVTSPVINTVYESDVALPWFVCWQAQGTGSFSGLFKVDNSVIGGDDRNNENWGNGWVMINGWSTSIGSCYMERKGTTSYPHSQINTSNSSTTRQFWQFPVSNQAFMGPSMGKGASGWLGMPNPFAYVTSNTATGALGDTCTIGGRTYTKTTSRLWVRTA